MSRLSEAEILERQQFLRVQRDKLLAMKKEAREKQLQGELVETSQHRPVSARAARSALHGQRQTHADTTQADKKMAMRKAIAEKLRQEVIGKQ